MDSTTILTVIATLLIAVVAAKFLFGGGGNNNNAPRRGTSSSTQTSTSSEEREICSLEEIQEEGLKEVEVEPDKKLLLVKQKGQVYALGAKCSHYGGPLAKGALGDGRIRCPWHGACFNIKTGDIEEYPCVDAIPTFQTRVENGKVFVALDKSKLSNFKRAPTSKQPSGPDSRVFVVVGAGPGGLTAVETLRQEGFSGRIILIGREKHLPYDRPKLSKTMNSQPDTILLRPASFFAEKKIETLLEVEVKELNPQTKTLALSNGQTLKYDSVLVATGGNPRPIPAPGFNLKNIYQLRTPEDSLAIINSVDGKKVVIVGTSFIGMEAASCIAKKASSVIAIGMEQVPFERVLGLKVGAALQKIHESNGIQFRLKRVVKEFRGTDDGNVSAVVLDDGEVLEADLCIIGAGIIPATEFVKADILKIERDRSIVVNEFLNATEGVYACGDLARYPYHMLEGESIRVEHYGMSQYQGRVAALNMLGQKVPVRSIPFFWTTQYGKRLNYAGHALTFDDVIVDGDLEGFKFVAYYIKGNKVLAVAAAGRDPIASIAAELMASNKMLTAEQVKNGTFIQ